MAISLKRPGLTALRPNIGWGKFFLCLIMIGISTAYVIAALYYDYVFDPRIADVPEWVYIFGFAALAYKGQAWLSEAAGGRRIVDHLTSRVMLVAIALAVFIWTDFPVVHAAIAKVSAWIGYPIVSVRTSYKVGVAIVFGALSILDWVRDWFGRRSSMYRGAAGGGLGTFEQAPHEPLDLASESGNPFMRTKGPLLIDVDECWVRLPNGRMFQIPFTERMIRRTEWNLADRGLPRPADPAAGGADAS